MTDTFGPFFAGRSRGVGGYETICIARGNPQDFDNLADAQIAWTAYDHGNAKEADLLCAAPDLLAALENVLEDFIAIGGKDSDRSGVIIEATSAIAKARGQQ
tara:strand:+ start:357 stop:662 length:306 start_codon:yes stop_codon:yes gene_type:complete